MTPKPSKLTPFADQIAARQYYRKDPETDVPLEDYEGMLRRVARHVARAEALDAYKADNGRYPEWYLSFEGRKKNIIDIEALDKWIYEQGYAGLCKKWEDEFFRIMIDQKFSPGGRILAGSESNHSQLMNCFCLASTGRYITRAKDDPDSIDGIYELSYKLAKVTKTGGGCGVNLDFMRESGAYVHGSGGRSSGPVSFLRMNYNTTLRVIKLEGVRRGAGMAALSIWHPDVLDFITAKDADREAVEGKIEAFNISLLITDAFMRAVEADELVYSKSVRTGERVALSPVPGKYHLPGHPATAVTGNPKDPATSKEIPVETGPEGPGVRAKWLWDEICAHAWQSGDPGILFVDRANEFWPMLEHLGPLRTTNPCGEEFLHDVLAESCCLGSMILDRYITPQGMFDFEAYKLDVGVAIRFLDNVLTMNVHPLEETQEGCDRLRRVGLGVMGDAALMMKLGVSFVSDEAMALREEIARAMVESSGTVSKELAVEKGEFPFFSKSGLVEDFTPRRNVHTLSIAPTGSISMIADTTSGIEPLFALAMQRRVGQDYMFRLDPTFEKYLREHRSDINLDDESQFVSVEMMTGHDALGKNIRKSVAIPAVVKAIMDNHGGIQGLNSYFDAQEQSMFMTAHDVKPEHHVKVQGIWQRSLDGPEMLMSATSKTTNLPNAATVAEVQKVFELGYKERVKGITMYRDGSKSAQVLRTDLGKTSTPEPEKTPEPKAKAVVPQLPNKVEVHRPKSTMGAMTKAEFRDANGRERKVYIYVGMDDNNYPVEVFITDEDGGHDVHPYAAALGKLVSTSLKYGAPPKKIARKLRKIEGGSVSYGGGIYQSVPAMVGRLLEERMAIYEAQHGQEISQADDCDGNCNMVSQGGCEVCLDCGKSKCS